jgi:hypothetical protein
VSSASPDRKAARAAAGASIDAVAASAAAIRGETGMGDQLRRAKASSDCTLAPFPGL